METWLGAVLVPIAVAGIGWLGVEFTGGVEGRQQRKILGYLAIAKDLGDTPEGRGARQVAASETARLLEERGTKAQLVAAALGAALCVITVLACTLILLITLTAMTGAARWFYGVVSVGLGVAYAFGAQQAWVHVKRVGARRREQRPSVLLHASGFSASPPA